MVENHDMSIDSKRKILEYKSFDCPSFMSQFKLNLIVSQIDEIIHTRPLS
jgi:hypothetical protein